MRAHKFLIMGFIKRRRKLFYFMLFWSLSTSIVVFYTGMSTEDQRAEDRTTRTILDEFPPNYLKHLEVPRNYPECGSIFPWRLASISKSGGHAERGASNLWFLILVKSAPQYMRNRNAIRNTWGGIEAIKGRLSRTVFVVARPGNDSTKQEALVQENKLFGDLLQCNFIDSYRALPMKVLSTFAWIVAKDINAKFYAMADDDLMLKTDKVYEFLSKKEAHAHEPHTYCGYEFNSGVRPIRNQTNKWYMDNATYPGIKYPDYCGGPMYSLTKPMIKSILCIASVTPYTDDFYLEDILITGVFRELLNQGQPNIEDGGSWIKYFKGGRADSKVMLVEAWRKMLADRDGIPSPLNALLSADGSRIRSMVTEENIKDFELAWDNFTSESSE